MTNIIVNDQTLLEPINLYCLPTVALTNRTKK